MSIRTIEYPFGRSVIEVVEHGRRQLFLWRGSKCEASGLITEDVFHVEHLWAESVEALKEGWPDITYRFRQAPACCSCTFCEPKARGVTVTPAVQSRAGGS